MDSRKPCAKCGVTKPRDAFSRCSSRRDGLQAWCKACSSAYSRSTYQSSPECRARRAEANQALRDRNRDFVWNHFLAHPCVDCEETDPIVLEFDHVRGTKLENVSVLIQSASLDRLRAEIVKCDVRCGNCHRVKTAREQRHWIYVETRKRGWQDP